MYTDGTSALKTEYYDDNVPEKIEVQKEKAPEKIATKPKNARMIKKRVVCAITLVFLMAITVLLRYAVIAKEYGELTKSRAELELINAKVVEKQVEAGGNLDPKKIEQEAERLGLQQPVQSQIKYISLGNTDNGEVLKTEETNALNAFINRVSGILEYLY